MMADGQHWPFVIPVSSFRCWPVVARCALGEVVPQQCSPYSQAVSHQLIAILGRTD